MLIGFLKAKTAALETPELSPAMEPASWMWCADIEAGNRIAGEAKERSFAAGKSKGGRSGRMDDCGFGGGARLVRMRSSSDVGADIVRKTANRQAGVDGNGKISEGEVVCRREIEGWALREDG